MFTEQVNYPTQILCAMQLLQKCALLYTFVYIHTALVDGYVATYGLQSVKQCISSAPAFILVTALAINHYQIKRSLFNWRICTIIPPTFTLCEFHKLQFKKESQNLNIRATQLKVQLHKVMANILIQLYFLLQLAAFHVLCMIKRLTCSYIYSTYSCY